MNDNLVYFPHPVPKATDRRIPASYEMRRRHPWLTEHGAKMIVSADLDGLISTLIMRHLFNWEIVGWYNTYEIAMRQDIDPAECIGVDSEFLTQTRHSIGHHFSLSGDHQLNINAEANVIPSAEWLLKSPQHTAKSLQPYFIRKYNLALAIFLFHLFGEELAFPKYDLPVHLLLLADSSWETYYKYAYDESNPNPKEHLEAMNMDYLLDILHSNRVEGNWKPSKEDLHRHPFRKKLVKHTCGFFKRQKLHRDINAPWYISTWSDRNQIRRFLVAINSAFGFRPIHHSELNFSGFSSRKLHHYETQFSPESFDFSPKFLDEMKQAGLWTHAILNCGRGGIRFGMTTEKMVTQEEFPVLHHYVTREKYLKSVEKSAVNQ